MSNGPVILIIDDDKYIRLQLRLILESQKLSVLEAESGNRAIELIEEQKPDLILLDLMLPGMGGEDILVGIRKRYNAEELPVIVVTADRGEMTFYKIKLLGAQDYVTKPFTKESLMQKVEAAVDIPKPDLDPEDCIATDITSTDMDLIKRHEKSFDNYFISLVVNLLIIFNISRDKNQLPTAVRTISAGPGEFEGFIRIKACKYKLMHKIALKPDAPPKDILKIYISMAYEECKRISGNELALKKISELAGSQRGDSEIAENI